MAKNHKGLPASTITRLSKHELLDQLVAIDKTRKMRKRVLALETIFRQRIDAHVASLPKTTASFDKFGTSPFVLLIHSRERSYSKVSELERDILPAKQFSSMETSAGRMVENVVLPVYGWKCVPSEMHTAYSAIDGKKLEGDTLHLVTLKSGPRCLNDEMSENFADAIMLHAGISGREAGVRNIHFTYGTLYGTHKTSNKKDWHILRNVWEKNPTACVRTPEKRWDCSFIDKKSKANVTVTVRVGLDWWRLLGGDTCFVEVMSAMIRACVTPCATVKDEKFKISDMSDIVSLKNVPKTFNVSMLQRSQLPWLFLMARHYCDSLVD